jgi:hypothetical protein
MPIHAEISNHNSSGSGSVGNSNNNNNTINFRQVLRADWMTKLSMKRVSAAAQAMD